LLGPLAEPSEVELQAQLAKMFQHQTLPVIAYPIDIQALPRVTLDAGPDSGGGHRRVQHGPTRQTHRVKIEMRVPDPQSAADVRRRMLGLTTTAVRPPLHGCMNCSPIWLRAR
jgi:hypothetical protein